MSSSVLFPTPITLVGSVLNPFAVKFADNQQGGVQAIYDQAGAALVNQRCGTFAVAGQRNSSFTAQATALTVPVVANNLVSVFGLYNPPNSGVWMELTTLNVVARLATTVVNGFGIYFSTVAKSALATFTTAGTVQANLVGGPQGKGQFWTAVTHSGTPALQTLCGGWGATTNSNLGQQVYRFDGVCLIPPGVLVSVANTTAGSGAANTDIQADWIEYNQ